MGYLAYFIALIWLVFQTTTGMGFNQGLDLFLDKAVEINKIFFFVAIALWVIVLIKAIVSKRKTTTGCLSIFLLLLPLFQGAIWFMSSQIASSFSQQGIVDPIKFWVLVGISVVIGLS